MMDADMTSKEEDVEIEISICRGMILRSQEVALFGRSRC